MWGEGSLISYSGGSYPCISIHWYSNQAIIYMSSGDSTNFRYFSNSPVNFLDGGWHFVAFVVPGNGQTDIANSAMHAGGVAESGAAYQTSGPQRAKAGPVYIGLADSGTSYFNGLIANVQVYNTTLSASEVQGLYAEGIGGAPALLQNLVGGPSTATSRTTAGTATMECLPA